MVSVIAASLFAIAATAAANPNAAGKAWLRNPPNTDWTAKGWVDVPTQDAYEVVASRETEAVSWLEEGPILLVDEKRARLLVGDHFVADPAKKPYLVRAVCGHGATGGYSLKRRGKELWIAHGSLGSSFRYQRSAFVINFEVPPEELYLTASIAR